MDLIESLERIEIKINNSKTGNSPRKIKKSKADEESGSKSKHKTQYLGSKQKDQKIKSLWKLNSSSCSNLLNGIDASKSSFLMKQPTLDITSLK